MHYLKINIPGINHESSLMVYSGLSNGSLLPPYLPPFLIIQEWIRNRTPKSNWLVLANYPVSPEPHTHIYISPQNPFYIFELSIFQRNTSVTNKQTNKHYQPLYWHKSYSTFW